MHPSAGLYPRTGLYPAKPVVALHPEHGRWPGQYFPGEIVDAVPIDASYTDVIAAAAPLRYWKLDETSGTSVAEQMTGDTGTAVGMVMGGAAGPDGIGGVCPLFSGSTAEFIRAHTGALLGGLAEYTIEIWGYYTPLASTDIRCLYGEMSTSSGNDAIRVEAKGSGSSASLRHVYGHDGAVSVNDSLGLALSNRWVLYHFTRDSSGLLTASWQAGQRMAVTQTTTNTWTNSNVEVHLGRSPRATDAWRGRLAHCAVYDRVLGKAERRAHYEAGTPLARSIITGTRWAAISPWNQLLTDPGNPPAIASNSADQVSKLVSQITRSGAGGTATNMGRGAVWLADNSTPTQRVRIQGGATGNPSGDKPALYNALGVSPLPAGFGPDPGQGSDLESMVFNVDTGDYWDYWVLKKALLAPEYVTATASGSGTIPAGSYFYAVSPQDADGNHGTARQAPSVAVIGSQGVSVSWGTMEGQTMVEVWRHISGDVNWHRIAVVPPNDHGFFDDGTYPNQNSFPSSAATGSTADWGCSYAGYFANADATLGYWSGARSNWGATAVSTPLLGGMVTLDEAWSGVIPHALAMAVVDTANSHVFPAQRHDYWPGTYNIVEGTRFQLDPAYDVNLIANPFARMVAKAYQDYGGYVTDHSAGISVAYVENDMGTGRSFWPSAYDGKQSYELFSNALFPFSQFRVIDPAWTLAQTMA